jgi:hypothetical protein
MAKLDPETIRLAAQHCQQAANDLMAALYTLRSMCDVKDNPEAWMLIPEAQTMLHKIQRNIQLTKESIHG